MITTKVKPVHSLAGNPNSPLQSAGMVLSLHQAETLEAVRNPKVEVIFNLAMTGDGKSLAAYLPTLLEGRPILAMYPTNELIHDQLRQVMAYQRLFDTKLNVGIMSSEELHQIRYEFELASQSKAIDWQTWQNPVVLTNPDILNLVANFKYIAEHQNPDALFQRLLERFDLFVFDEFHLYDVAQVNSVLSSLLYVFEQSRCLPVGVRKKFLFLSATPNPLLLECLGRAGIVPRMIEGRYDFSEVCPPGWRTITQPADLSFHPVGRQAEQWIEENFPLIVEWFDRHPGSRGAIIVNSVATAKRLVRFFNNLRKEGKFPLSVGENTGLTGAAERRFALLESDLLVGTSTVDVGVDFKINFLIFEALNAGAWIQRFGRLGRHRGYERPNGDVISFKAYAAHSLLPRYSYERLEELLTEGKELDRIRLFTQVKGKEDQEGIFSPVNDFRYYQRSWGWLSMAHVLNTLGHPRLRENYAATRKGLARTYSEVLGLEVEDRVKWYYAITQKSPQLIEEAVLRFRGEGPFDCGILDETDGEVKAYDLLWVLRHTEAQLISKGEFLKEVEQRGLMAQRFKYLDIFLRLQGYLEEARRVRLVQRRDIASEFVPGDYRKVHVLGGFQVDMAFIGINRINRVLERKPFLCLINPILPEELRARLRLPALFPLYKLLDVNGNEFSVAFSKEALLLSSQPLIFKDGEKDG